MELDARFKLQTMETGVPSIAISKNGIFLSKNFYRKISEPSHVQVYLSEGTKEMVIVPCDSNAESAVALRITGGYARIYNNDFVNSIASLVGKTLNDINLRVTGTLIDGYYVFDLKTARAGKPKNIDEE